MPADEPPSPGEPESLTCSVSGLVKRFEGLIERVAQSVASSKVGSPRPSGHSSRRSSIGSSARGLSPPLFSSERSTEESRMLLCIQGLKSRDTAVPSQAVGGEVDEEVLRLRVALEYRKGAPSCATTGKKSALLLL